MKKKQRLILGVSIVAVLLGYLALTSGVVSNQYEVSEAVAAKDKLANKIIIVNGSLISGTDRWNPATRELTFKMTDGITTIDVVWIGEKPDIPPGNDTDVQVVVTGRFNKSVFEAYKKPLTKCPSKYTASPEKIGQ